MCTRNNAIVAFRIAQNFFFLQTFPTNTVNTKTHMSLKLLLNHNLMPTKTINVHALCLCLLAVKR